MIVLIDTNIILDVLLKRNPYTNEAQIIISKCANRDIIGYLAAHSIPNLFYILRKTYSHKERRRFIKNLCDVFYISALNVEKIKSAIENEEFKDFEDCLQEECAVEVMADYIITRNPDDYKNSRIKVIQPDEFIKLLELDNIKN